MSITEAFNRDSNQVPITGLGLIASKAITYAALTTGAVGATDLFTVTGTVALRIFAVCSTLLDSDGAATIEVGIAGSTAGLIAQTTATTIDADEIWIDATPAKIETLPSLSILTDQTIIQTIATETIKAGVLTYYCCWTPVSTSARVVAA